jgi:hypothetical protein
MLRISGNFFSRCARTSSRKVSIECLLVEELDPADGDRRGASRVLLDILDVQEILSKFLLGDEVGGFVVMLGELTNSSHVAFLGSLRVASELKTLDHSLSKFSHSDTSCLS